MRAALEETSTGDRLVLTLFYVEDMSQREIGRALGISENAVKQRLARGRSHFKGIYSFVLFDVTLQGHDAISEYGAGPGSPEDIPVAAYIELTPENIGN